MYNTLALNTLNIILPFLNSLNPNWCLIGTTGLILHGLENKSEDIDIVVDTEGARKLDQLMRNFKIHEVSDIAYDHISSELSEYEIGGTKIHVLSNLKLKVNEGYLRLSEIIRNKEIFDFNGYKVFIPSLPDQLNISRLMGREKDMLQAEKIQSFLQE